MTMVKDVFEGLKLVAEGIDSVKKISEAVKTGEAYVRAKHPEIRPDLRALLEELSKSMLVIKKATTVLTNFRFATSPDVLGSELRVFNNYFIQADTEAQQLRNHIDDLRTHCSVIRKHGSQISGEATAEGFAKIFSMLGLNSPERERDLGKALDRLAYQDDDVSNSAETMLDCLERALKEVQASLGEGGAMYPERIPAAAALLAKYSPEFERMEELAASQVEDVRKLAQALR